MNRIRSFRLRITLLFVGFFSVLFVLFGIFFYGVLARDLKNRLDESLSSSAETAGVLFVDEMEELNGDPIKAAAEVVPEVRMPAGLIAIFEGDRLLRSSQPLSLAEYNSIVPRATAPGAGDLLFAAPRLGPHGAHIATHRLIARGQNYLTVAIEPLDAIVGDLAAVRSVLLTALPLLIGLAGAGGYLVARRSLAPLNLMVEQARRITGQNLDSRLDIGPAAEELTVVAASFNELLSRLHQTFEGMRRFVADASHELRTPLSVIRGEADVALAHERTSAEYREALAVILDESRRLTLLVDALLNLARADAGQNKLFVEQFYLNDLVAECCRSAQPAAQAGNIHLECRANPDVQFCGDEELLRHLVANLLDNAIRYTPAGGRVTVDLDVEGRYARLSVSDTGIGIPPDAAQHVFERFFRVDKARSRQNGGLGLGLAIVKWITEAHHGEVALASEPGSGSRFTVTLPTNWVAAKPL